MNYLIAVYTGRKIYTLGIKPGVTATVGDAENDTLPIPDSGLGGAYLVLACDAGGVRVLSRQPMQFGTEKTINRVLSAGEKISITEKITLAVFEAKSSLDVKLPLDSFDELRIGRSYNKNDICLKNPTVSTCHALLRKVNDKWVIADLNSRNGTFVNKELAQEDVELPAEDVDIFICGYMFYIHDNVLIFQYTSGEIEFAPDVTDALIPLPARQKSYPFFQRSPRIRMRAEKSEFNITPPPNAGAKPSISWISILLPPCMMVLVMGTVAFFTKNYNMLIYSLPMSMISVVVTIVNNKNNMKKWLKKNGLAVEKYSAYLADTDKQITDSEGAFISVLSITNPGVAECLSIAQNVSRRLWERTPRDNDFLSVRVGTGSSASNVTIKLPNTQISIEDNPFINQAQAIHDKHTTLTGIPVCHSLLKYPTTGLAGRREDVLNTTWRIIMDIATHHSYEEVKIICVYPEEERSQWEWIRWLPHIWDDNHILDKKLRKRYLVCTREDSKFMLRKIADIMKDRRSDPSSNSTLPMPFYVMILADRTLVESSGEKFFPEKADLGFAAVYAYGDGGGLYGECQSVITCGKNANIQNTEPDRQTLTQSFTPDIVSVKILDEFARALAPVHIVSIGGGRMPSKISFFEGVGAKTIEDLDVAGRWEIAEPTESLAAPMGIKENGDTFYFNILDGYMGPHGMTVGTAGSGKTETLTTLLLSMALTFSPEDLNFAIIEFKGESLSSVLKPLPHVAGVITNLNDPSIVIRGISSLVGELKRRQRVFAEVGLQTQDLLLYQKYRKDHPELNLDPIPFLIIVIDEFAEFIGQFPEFNEEIASIARVGRSPGMYMILTMQSPQGVIKQQVESNLNFRICMRTATESDSKGILGVGDAFRLSAPGRTIIKVKADPCEQIQTFFAKAPYNPGSSQVSAVEELHVVEIDGKRTQPEQYKKALKAKKENDKKKGELTQGTLVVNEIVKTAKELNLRHAIPVWTEPLPTVLYLNTLISGHTAFDRESKTWHEKNTGLAVTVGIVDDPQKQKQYPFVFDFVKDKHQVLYGISAEDKTTFLQTVIVSAALSYTPDQVNFVMIDYGSYTMGMFEVLPHCLIAADPYNEDKIKKAQTFLENEISSRGKMFSDKGIGSLEAYREATGQPMPAILVFVDNIAAFYRDNTSLMSLLEKITRDGDRVGIYLVVSAASDTNVHKLANFVKSYHALKMQNKNDYKSIFSGTEIKIDLGNHPGRGFTKINENVLEYQTAFCVEGDNEVARSNNLKVLLEEMSSSWTGKRASITEADEALSAPVEAGELGSSVDGVDIGVAKANRNPVRFNYRDMHGCVISGADGSGKSSVLAMIAQALDKEANTRLYVYEEKPLIEKLCTNAVIMHNPEEAEKVIAELAEEYPGRGENTKDRIVLCLDEFLLLYHDLTDKAANILEAIARGGLERKMYIYVACTAVGLDKFLITKVKLFKELLNGGNAIAIGGRLKDYRAFNDLHQSENMVFGEHEGAMIHKNKVTPMLFGKPREEKAQ